MVAIESFTPSFLEDFIVDEWVLSIVFQVLYQEVGRYDAAFGRLIVPTLYGWKRCVSSA